MQGEQLFRSKYTTLVFENSLLIIKQITVNSKKLISILLNANDKLTKDCKYERVVSMKVIIQI